MQFLGGYGRHPPLTGWIARVWYSVFPAANWSSYALSAVTIAVSLFSIYLLGERVLGRRRAMLAVFAMMLYPLFIGAKADRFNNYQVLLADGLAVSARIRQADGRVGSGAWAGRGCRHAHNLFSRLRSRRHRTGRRAAFAAPAILL
jgi:4-amino-4-deoxy-L-arabinose transferase-like glycosyltransferase